VKALAVLIGWMLACLPPVWAADDGKAWPYRRIADALHMHDLMQPAIMHAPSLEFRLRLTPQDQSIDLVSLELRTQLSGREVVFPATRFGSFDLPFSAALYEQNPPVHVNKGAAQGLNLGVELRLRGSFVDGVDLAAVARGVAQYDAAVHAAGWKYRVFAPRLTHLVVRAAPGRRGCHWGEGRVDAEALADAAGQVRIGLKDLSVPSGIVTCDGIIEEVLLEAR
jgi:hypothetical protein